MKKKKIEFNLIGAIFMVFFLSVIIVCAIKFISKIIKEKNAENAVVGAEEILVDEDMEMLEVVNISGADELIVMKNCKGTFNYVMKYDSNKFRIEKNVEGIDKFNSLISDSILLTVAFMEGDLGTIKEELLSKYGESTDRKSGMVEECVVNELNGIREIYETDGILYKKVYIQKDNGYYVISVNYGLDFEEKIDSIIEKMVNSFYII